MWNEDQRKRFQELRTGDREKTLTQTEQTELARMIHELEEEEAAYLRPATQRLEQRNRETDAQNAALKILVDRQKRLNRYLQRVLQKVDRERQEISMELASIMGSGSPTGISR